eukprot:CAMPEP_0194408360 /NCGR_PEP_ID=MMETSP0176-20130528/6259_1 /TAXON_ID=216777 /ORGANISM="Proboscia alata, Strain PI-D3" /LENGTH=230 /DNA_ID=CAMNT_0039208425 /DNA_START=151 /DNA_END=844 /DNA_ORIENTATION=+
MPTMRSISFPDSSPQLEILGGNHHNHDNKSKNSMSTPTETESDTIASLRRISIQTPQALLSRDPQQLSESLNISVSEVLTLRANVAESCLSNTMGADVPRRESKGSPPIDQEDVVHDRSDQNDSAGMSPKRHTKKRRRAATDQADSSSSPVTCPRVTPLFPGAITALDQALHAAPLPESSARLPPARYPIGCNRISTPSFHRAPDQAASETPYGLPMVKVDLLYEVDQHR